MVGRHLKAMADCKSYNNGDILSAVRPHYYRRPAQEHLMMSASPKMFEKNILWMCVFANLAMQARLFTNLLCWYFFPQQGRTCKWLGLALINTMLWVFRTLDKIGHTSAVLQDRQTNSQCSVYEDFPCWDPLLCFRDMGCMVHTSPIISWCSSCTGATTELP